MAAALTPRGRALRRLSTHRGITEDPPGSNSDQRPDRERYGDRRWGIKKAQLALAPWLVGLPWCGTWCAWALRAAGVQGVSYRLASVALIEDDARRSRAPFSDWRAGSEWRSVLRGDLVVWYGRGVHVEVVRAFKQAHGQVFVVTDGGNTSSGPSGSQSNGGGSFRRVRPLSAVHGFARVDYPGGTVRRRVDRAAMRLEAARAELQAPAFDPAVSSSDRLLVVAMSGLNRPFPESAEAMGFYDAVKEAV